MKTSDEISKTARSMLTDEERRLLESDEYYFEYYEVKGREATASKLLKIEVRLGINEAIQREFSKNNTG